MLTNCAGAVFATGTASFEGTCCSILHVTGEEISVLDARHYRCWLTLLLTCVLAGTACAESDDLEERMAFARQVDAELINNPAHSAHWLSHGRNYAEDRFSLLKQVSVENIDELTLAWSLDLPSKGAFSVHHSQPH